jgi:hypothetical protein
LEEKFAQLLTEGIHRIRLREAKTIQVIQDELGYAVGREGGSSVEYWRKGHLPPDLATVETLARELIRRGQLGRDWLEQFLESARHPYPEHLCAELFSSIFLENMTAERRPVQQAPHRRGASQSKPQIAKRIFISGDTTQDREGTPNKIFIDSLQVKNDPLPGEVNPFIVGPPISQPRYFFGRDYEIKRIFGLWRRFPLQNVAVIGPKRSGKTSLLHYLEKITLTPPEQLRPSQQTNWLPQPEQYRWVFVDFQDARMGHRERLLRYLLTSLDMPIPEPCDLENFMDIVSLQLDSPTIILMDEISAGLASPELDQQFWGSLRSLGSNLTGGNLAFLLTSHEAPAQLAEEHGKPSPFFNIFGHTFKLGALKETEALELIASSPYPFDQADINWIMAQSGCWPYLLQILCHARLTALEYQEAGDSWKREGMRQMAPYWYLLG